MQKINMYSIFDKKSNRYDTPFFTFDEIGAKRHFIMITRDKKSMVSQFKDSFDLYHLGVFDIVTGEFKYEKELILEGKEIQNA